MDRLRAEREKGCLKLEHLHTLRCFQWKLDEKDSKDVEAAWDLVKSTAAGLGTKAAAKEASSGAASGSKQPVAREKAMQLALEMFD